LGKVTGNADRKKLFSVRIIDNLRVAVDSEGFKNASSGREYEAAVMNGKSSIFTTNFIFFKLSKLYEEN
jgi:hypothetical protein